MAGDHTKVTETCCWDSAGTETARFLGFLLMEGLASLADGFFARETHATGQSL